jgi:FMN phosphatase YigB (HAD superfamily)
VHLGSLALYGKGEAEMIRTVLEKAGLLSFLDDVVSADEVRDLKTHLAIIRYSRF